jgi:hypothetical protein
LLDGDTTGLDAEVVRLSPRPVLAAAMPASTAIAA